MCIASNHYMLVRGAYLPYNKTWTLLLAGHANRKTDKDIFSWPREMCSR